jgi:hypothetical protein
MKRTINGHLPTNISALIDCLFVFLKKKHLNTSSPQDWFVYYSIVVGVLKVVALLLRAGADPNAKDNWSYTPLHEVKNSTDIQLDTGAPSSVRTYYHSFSVRNLCKFLASRIRIHYYLYGTGTDPDHSINKQKHLEKS